MARYRVCFDGKWQADFDDRAEAVQWAREVAETGRLAHVVKSGPLWTRLLHVFPEEKADDGRLAWRARFGGSAWDGS